MIVTPGPLAAPAARLLAALAAKGHDVRDASAGPPAGDGPVTLAISDGPFVFDFAGLVRAIAPRPFRVLVLSRLGAHPDAKAASLQRLWRMEEHVRGGGAPTLTLRFAPLLGPDTPLWNRLRTQPSLPRGGRTQLNPVAERDAVETLVRALGGDAPWGDWFEVAGPRVWTLGELRDLARDAGRGRDAGEWEPALDEMAEHRLAESAPWCARFPIAPTPIEQAVRGEVTA
ncbi:MAG: hypothetical protein HZA61_16925 [Candidatus Eisenbacteria bacterium]|uniref:Uncharacterized protein n=1 Tax=Eiseniibacteriota bacterium TaxID=2212470 RepID=A0A933SIZ6_UNCEI|nr:hypothetical protein [Candidatus Eisenbacteria bacterium]